MMVLFQIITIIIITIIIIIIINLKAADILPPSDWDMLRNKAGEHNWGNKSADWSNFAALLIF